MKAEELVDDLGDSLPKVDVGTLNDTLAKVNAQPLFDALAYTLAEMESKTLINTVDKAKPETLVDALAYWPKEEEPETLCGHWPMLRAKKESMLWLTVQQW